MNQRIARIESKIKMNGMIFIGLVDTDAEVALIKHSGVN